MRVHPETPAADAALREAARGARDAHLQLMAAVALGVEAGCSLRHMADLLWISHETVRGLVHELGYEQGWRKRKGKAS